MTQIPEPQLPNIKNGEVYMRLVEQAYNWNSKLILPQYKNL